MILRLPRFIHSRTVPADEARKSLYAPVKRSSDGCRCARASAAKDPCAPEVARPFAESPLRLALIVIIAYGQIIPARLLDIPKHGWINLHASLLPKYRGAAPINWAIANGETRTGNTTMRVDAGMDTGEMLLQQALEIGAKETAPELLARLSEAGAGLITETLRGLQEGTLHGRPQNNSEATLAPILKREDGLIETGRGALLKFSIRCEALRHGQGPTACFEGKRATF